MLGSKILAASMLMAVAAAQTCSSDVSEAFIATIDNSTYFDTCAEGVTFNITSVFDVLNFTDSDFMAFCNSSTCLEPLHELMGSVDCLIEYQGSARNLSAEVDDLHHECHEALEATESSGSTMDMSMSGMDHDHMDMGGDSSSSDSGSASSGASSVVMTAGSLATIVIAAAAFL